MHFQNKISIFIQIGLIVYGVKIFEAESSSENDQADALSNLVYSSHHKSLYDYSYYNVNEK